jgi:hypothetical protein
MREDGDITRDKAVDFALVLHNDASRLKGVIGNRASHRIIIIA